jgi:AcrR family transcriptional regulator
MLRPRKAAYRGLDLDQTVARADELRCIVYASTASDLWPESGLQALVERARTRNSNQAITGQLLYNRRQFVQLLEGPGDAVETLFQAISRDERHHSLRLILRRDVPGRAFPGWAMAEAAAPDDIQRAIGRMHLGGNVSFMDNNSLAELSSAPPPDGATQLRVATQQDRARDTVERIFNAARAIRQCSGLSALTVPMLARTAGITQPTFYRYFSNVDDLIRAGLRRIMMRRLAGWQAAIRAQHFTSDAHLAEIIAQIGTRHFMNLSDVSPKLMQALLPHIEAVAPEAVPPFARTVLEAMQRSRLPGAVDIDEALLTALLAGLMGAGINAARHDMASLRTDAARRVCAGMFLGGLRALQAK